jgi:hypothetical protein
MVKDGATSIDFEPAVMARDGGRFYGILTNSSGAEYDALLFAMEFTNIPDADNDGIPDISDGEISGGEGLVLTLDEWNRLDFSWVYPWDTAWGLSTYMGNIFVTFYPYVYQENLGWLYHFSANGEDHVFYDWELGFILANEGFGGFYYIYTTDSWHEFGNPQP